MSLPGSMPSARKILPIIIAISVLLRLATSVFLGDQILDMPGTADQISYHTLAQRVLEGNGFTFPKEWWPVTAAGAPTAHWSFLYTFYLVGVYALFGVHPLAARIIQAILVGVLQPLLAYWIGKRVFNPLVGLLAALITTLYSYFIYYAATLMTEPYYITAILAALYLSILLVEKTETSAKSIEKKNLYRLAVLLGISLGFAALLRQLLMLIIPFLFLWILWVGGRKRFFPLVLSGVIVVCFILPFTIFNYTRFDRFVLLNTNSGYAFYFGNHPSYGTRFIPILPSGTYIKMIPPELRSLDEASLDSELLKRGLQFIADDPARYIQLTLSRIPAYFMFWPSYSSSIISNLARMASFGIMLPFMLIGVVRALLRKPDGSHTGIKSPAILLLLFCLLYTSIHLLSWALIRYRLPVDAVLTAFAGLTMYDLYTWWSTRRTNALKGTRQAIS
jgi:4-amino-4-deoxy-L-arabinose transferase-like glycosyltransferase